MLEYDRINVSESINVSNNSREGIICYCWCFKIICYYWYFLCYQDNKESLQKTPGSTQREKKQQEKVQKNQYQNMSEKNKQKIKKYTKEYNKNQHQNMS